MIILDVGCGDMPKGDVNIDLFPHVKALGREGIPTTADIFCDGRRLPFRDGTFEKVLCHHVIEHTTDPFGVLVELVRVSSQDIEIRTPHRYSVDALRDPHHVSFFNARWFTEACSRLDVDCRVSVSLREVHIPFGFLRLSFKRPDEIVAHISKLGSERGDSA